MVNIEIMTKFSRLKSVSSIDDDYLETTTGGVLLMFRAYRKNIKFLKILLQNFISVFDSSVIVTDEGSIACKCFR